MKLKNHIIKILIVLFVLNYMPFTVLAEDNEPVLDSIGHKNTDTVIIHDGLKDITLTVPYSYAETTVDLSNGLYISYDESMYKYVVAVADSAAVVGGDPVNLNVTYCEAADGSEAKKYQTSYAINVVREKPKSPEFSGVINKKGVFPGRIGFSSSDFLAAYRQNDGAEPGYISITGSNLKTGRLLLDGVDYKLGSLIEISRLDSLTFLSLSSGTSSYNVSAYTVSDDSVSVGTAILNITVSSLTPPILNGAFAGSVTSGSSILFNESSFTKLCDLKGGNVVSVEISPVSSVCGVWYLNNEPVSGTVEVLSNDLNQLSFKGVAAGSASFKFRIKNEAGYSDYGTGVMTVSALYLTPESHKVSNVMRGHTIALSSSEFDYTPASASLKYIKITETPSDADGYICLTKTLPKSDALGYPALPSGKALSKGAIIPYDFLDYLTVVTKSTAPDSSVSFRWAATADDSALKAAFGDSALYTAGFTSAGDISYDTDLNLPVTLNALDFSTEFENKTGSTLSYVTFTLPEAVYGILYLNYNESTGKGTTVAKGTKYYKSDAPCISNISFVPAKGYTGDFSITYFGYAADGSCAAGSLKIYVSDRPGGTLSYNADKNCEKWFDAKDFKSAFQSATGAALSYVKFTIPGSSCGKLYYSADLTSDDAEPVSSGVKYYVNSKPYISYVFFKPKEDYTGDVNISFTAFAESGNSYKGTLKIKVSDSPAGTVVYNNNVNSPINLCETDFKAEFIKATGSVLSYVTFTVSKDQSGVLYTNYSNSTGKGSTVSSGKKFYAGSDPSISGITFVPNDGYSGIAFIPYLAYTSSGVSYSGKLIIKMEPVPAGNVYLKTGTNEKISLDGAVINQLFSYESGSSISYARFNPPSESFGKLYYNDPQSKRPKNVAKEDRYFIKNDPSIYNLVFEPAKDYTGSVTIPFTLYDQSNKAYTGSLIITINETKSFDDITNDYTWAKEAIDYLYRENIINGTGNGNFSPQNTVSRGDFILMICRAFKLSSSASSNFSDVNKDNYYYQAVATAEELGIVTGSEGKFYPDRPISREEAMVIILRAMSGLNKFSEKTSPLTGFSDANELSDYAKDAAANLVSHGIMSGYNGKLNPKNSITRAETAVIIYRVLTM